MYFYLDVETTFGAQRHILTRLLDGGVESFPLHDDNPNKVAFDAWLAQGNEPELWNPDKE